MRYGKKIISLKNIKAIITDVDGTLTDGRIYYGTHGEELKVFDSKDGPRIRLAIEAGIKVFFITTNITPAIKHRAQDKKVSGLISKSDKKMLLLKKFFNVKNIDVRDILYIGDDINDLPFMRQVGIPVAVANAAQEVKNFAVIITKQEGGNGAVGEIIQRVLEEKGKWANIVKSLKK